MEENVKMQKLLQSVIDEKANLLLVNERLEEYIKDLELKKDNIIRENND